MPISREFRGAVNTYIPTKEQVDSYKKIHTMLDDIQKEINNTTMIT